MTQLDLVRQLSDVTKLPPRADSPKLFDWLGELGVPCKTVGWDGIIDNFPQNGHAMLVHCPVAKLGEYPTRRLLMLARAHGHVLFSADQLIMSVRARGPFSELRDAVNNLLVIS